MKVGRFRMVEPKAEGKIPEGRRERYRGEEIRKGKNFRGGGERAGSGKAGMEKELVLKIRRDAGLLAGPWRTSREDRCSSGTQKSKSKWGNAASQSPR